MQLVRGLGEYAPLSAALAILSGVLGLLLLSDEASEATEHSGDQLWASRLV